MNGKLALTAAAAALLLSSPLPARSNPAVGDPDYAKALLMRSIGFKTVKGQGQVPAYAAYIASLLKESGYADADIEIIPVGETASLIARLRGTDAAAKPIVLLGHMDVVEAKAEDWGRDPFTAVEENGYIFGRGADDNKFDVSMMIATMARLKSEGFRPRRDVVLALSGAEETGWDSTRVLAEKLADAEFVLNGDGGGGRLGTNGEPLFYTVQAGEKTYVDYKVEFTDPGGHSSTPTATNPIHRLAHALARLDAYQFPTQASELTRASLKSASKRVPGRLGEALAAYADDPTDAEAAAIISAEPSFVGQIRTTCVPTMVEAGHAPNALPQRAVANINCRIFPGFSIEEIQAELARVLGDPTATISAEPDALASDASPLREDVMGAVARAVHARYPGLEVAPGMSAGATDSLIFRAAGIPSYSVSGLFQRDEDDFVHGLNERVPVSGIAPALAHWRSLVTDLSK